MLKIKNNVGGSGGAASGQYVWKKYAKDQISFEWVEQDSVTREYIYNVSADNIDTTKITAEYFVGASGYLGASGNYVFQSSDTFYSNLTTCSFVYDSFNSQIRFDESFGNAWNIFPCDINYFISYVVTNDSNTYPDGGIQDGYWYEKVK